MISQQLPLISKGKPGKAGKVPCFPPRAPLGRCPVPAGRSVCKVDLGWLVSNSWAGPLKSSERDRPAPLAASVSPSTFPERFWGEGCFLISSHRVSLSHADGRPQTTTLIMGRVGPHPALHGSQPSHPSTHNLPAPAASRRQRWARIHTAAQASGAHRTLGCESELPRPCPLRGRLPAKAAENVKGGGRGTRSKAQPHRRSPRRSRGGSRP